MVVAPRFRPVAAALTALGAGTVALLLSTPAMAETPQGSAATEPWCAVTGHVVSSEEEVTELRAELRQQEVRLAGGTPLDREDTWVLPDGGYPVVVLDSTVPLTEGAVFVSVAGERFEVATHSLADEDSHRYVTNVTMPHLGPTTRVLGMEVDSGSCTTELMLVVDRSLWSTMLGQVAVAVTALFGLLTVLVARLRKGGWLRRFLFAAPLGVVAGAGQVVLLHEAGMLDPFGSLPWWGPVAGLVVAALLPLTRWRGRAAGAAVPATEPMPTHATLGQWRPVAVFARDDDSVVYVAESAAAESPAVESAAAESPAASAAGGIGGDERVLLKVVTADRVSEPAARERLEHEARLLSQLSHPNCVRLRETLGEDGPPTLVLEHVDGAPLARMPAGVLSGPQAVTVAEQVLAALTAVHDQGLVHRDVRPDNVWLDRDGRVLLAGFGHAGPGVAHPVTSHAVAPYASPEQVEAQVLDARADLFPVAVMLGELLGDSPEPIAAVLAAAGAADREQRPASADDLAARLREAAAEAYGADWADRGALAAAVTAHGALGAAVAGYSVAGAGAGGGVAAGSGVAGAGAVGQPVAPASAGIGGAATAASSGKVGTAVSAAAAVAAAAVVSVGAVVLDSQPAHAQPVVITPEQARVIFIRTMDDGLAQRHDYIPLGARGAMHALATSDDSIAVENLTGIEIGVPPGQDGYPAWFVASGQIPYDDEGVAYVFARFDREDAEESWLLTGFIWSSDAELAAPEVDGDGWLAEVPETFVPALSPQELADTYADWISAQGNAIGGEEVEQGEVVDHEPFEWLPHPDSYVVQSTDHPGTAEGLARPAELVWPDGGGIVRLTWWIARERDDEEDEDDAADEDGGSGDEEESPPATFSDVTMVPLAGDTVLVSLTLTAENRLQGIDDDGNDGACGEFAYFRYEGEDYRLFASEHTVRVQFRLPLVPVADATDASPHPTGSPAPTVSPEPTGSPAPPDEASAGDDEDEDGEDGEQLRVLVADPVLGTEHATEDSELC